LCKDGIFYRPHDLSLVDSHAFIGFQTPVRIRSIFTITSRAGIFVVVERYAPLTAAHKQQDPFIEFGFEVAGTLFYDLLSKPEVVAADKLSGVFGKTAYYNDVIRVDVIHVMPRNKVHNLL
jgi:hypothetical protein